MVLRKKLLILGAILIAPVFLGYYLGYDQGFEKGVKQNKELVVSCEKEAETKAREDLKPKYGDALSFDFVLGSPHYKEHYSKCLSEKVN